MSTVAFASGTNIAWGERSLAHTLGFPRQASLRDRSPESSEPFGTLGSFVCTPETRWAELYPEFVLLSSQVHTWECLVLPGFHGYSKNFVPQIRRFARRDNMRQLPQKKKIRWRAFFRSFHRNDIVYQVAKLHRIPSFTCKINASEFFFRHFGTCYFGTTLSVCMFGNTVFCME